MFIVSFIIKHAHYLIDIDMLHIGRPYEMTVSSSSVWEILSFFNLLLLAVWTDYKDEALTGDISGAVFNSCERLTKYTSIRVSKIVSKYKVGLF